MQIAIKAIWITATVAVSLAMTWFLLGSTAVFQRQIDLIETAIYVFVWTPALIFIGLSVFLIKKGWTPNNIFIQIGLLMGIIILSVIVTTTLFRYTNTGGWLTEIVTKNWHSSVPLQKTEDGKYEYQIELINHFQRNGRARLYVRDISTGEDFVISVGIRTREIGALSVEYRPISEESRLLSAWSKLTLSDTENVYILTTTERLKYDIEAFEIDMEARTSRRIE